MKNRINCKEYWHSLCGMESKFAAKLYTLLLCTNNKYIEGSTTK
jgi:hypothetical protein